MKILLDMNLSPDWIPVLNSAGHDSLHWSAIGNPKSEDIEILSWARENEFIVFTHDLDFGAILASTNEKSPSVIQLRSEEIFPYKKSEIIISALKHSEEFLNEGALITIDDKNFRIKILPLKK